MKTSLITAAALSIALVGCKTTEPPTFEQDTNDIYVWDDSKSTAKNWADIAVVPNGVKDAEIAEDAQALVSEAEQNAWTLASFATGGFIMGLGMNSVFGIIDDAQQWWPTFVVLVAPQKLTSNNVLNKVESKLIPMFEQSTTLNYKGISYKSMSRSWSNAVVYVSGEDCPTTISFDDVSHRHLETPTGESGCLMDINLRVMDRVKLADGTVKDVISVEMKGLTNRALGLAKGFDGPVVFPVNYPVKMDGEEMKLPFPFVLKTNEAYLFTKSNESISFKFEE